MMDNKTIKQRLEDAYQPAKEAMRLHPFYRGKLEVVPKCRIRDFNDFAVWYTPGVAEPCKDIAKNPDQSFVHTNRANTIAIVTDGTRVLGLGDIGPLAAMPVMEGKAILYKYLGGVDAFPICLDTKDPQTFIRTVKMLQPSFGGFNLEDIAKPKCFHILDTLRRDCEVPVWHDDQQGTAAVTVAGMFNAIKIINRNLADINIVLNGAGAANVAIARLLMTAGADHGRIIMVDREGTLHKGRTELKYKEPVKWHLAERTNARNLKGDLTDALKDADALISLSASGPGVISKEQIKQMNKDPIVFVCANPVPEIWPWEAKEAGAAIVATGRSDFPNQVNNSLGFPGIFRGTLDVAATTITDEMCITAAEELAKCAEDKGLSEEHLLPTMDEWEVYPREAVAVGQKAIEQGVARIKLTPEEAFKMAEAKIKRAREQTQCLMREGFIPEAPEDNE